MCGLMKEQIQKLLHATPFEPFAVEISDTVMYSIPTRDHVLAAKNGLFVMGDDELVDFISWPHIRRLTLRNFPFDRVDLGSSTANSTVAEWRGLPKDFDRD